MLVCSEEFKPIDLDGPVMRTTAIFASELTKTGSPRSCEPVYSAARWASANRTWLAWTLSPALYTGNHGRFDMKKLVLAFCMLPLLGLITPTAPAATIDLFEGHERVDGSFADIAGSFGLGTITLTLNNPGAGSHLLGVYLDYEIDEPINTFFNEYGIEGLAPAGLSWEIDEPGFVFGDIYAHFNANSLDNTNSVPSGFEDDVAMAMIWDVTLAAGWSARATFLISDTAPQGFYLTQVDPDSVYALYMSSYLETKEGQFGPTIPEPSTIILVLSGLGLAVAARFRRSV